MSIENLLEEVIVEDLENIKELEVGSDEYKVAVDSVAKLLDKAIEMDKIQLEVEEKAMTRELEEKNREKEEALKLKQIKEEKIDKIVKNTLTGVSIIGGLGVTVWGALKSWKFEETGTITTTAGRKFIGNLFFKK